MIRCFESSNIQSVNKDINPIRDLEIIETEMKLADLESIQKRLDKKTKKINDKKVNEILELTSNCINNDIDISEVFKNFSDKEVKLSGLLSLKPKLFVCNVDEQSVSKGN